MNKQQIIKGICKVFGALGSETNMDLFFQICEKPLLTTEIKSDLTVMPLNRRLNILKEAGLIERIALKGQVGKNIENRVISSKFPKLLKELMNKEVK